MHQRWEKTIKRFENFFHLVMKSVAHYLFQCILWFTLIKKVIKTGHVRRISEVFNGSGTNQYLYFPLILSYFCRTSENPKAPSFKGQPEFPSVRNNPGFIGLEKKHTGLRCVFVSGILGPNSTPF